MRSAESSICVDANLVIRLLIETSDTRLTDLWTGWRTEHRTLVAPSLLHFEVANGLHQYAAGGHRSAKDMAYLLTVALQLPINVVDDDDLHAEAMAMAARVGISSVYDAHYLALAARLGIEFWTLDKRLHNAIRHHLPWVRFVPIDQ